MDDRMVTFLAPDSLEAEQYRALRQVLEQRGGATGVIAVTSAVPGEGKTTTALNLAETLAQDAAARVLLVDADLRRPGAAGMLGLPDRLPGLVESASAEGVDSQEFIRRPVPHRLCLLPAGRATAHPYELLRSRRFAEIIRAARTSYDTVVVDTPPVLPVPDVRVIAPWIDGFLLVVAADRTPRRLVQEAVDVLDPARVIGIVLNGDARSAASRYGDYVGYGRARGEGRVPAFGRVARRLAKAS